MKNPLRSTKDLSRIYAAWFDYAAARKRRGDLLRKVAKTLSIALQDAASAKSSRGPTPLLDPELLFEPSVPVYPIMCYAWMFEGVEGINILEVLDQVEPWRVWWLTRPSEHPYHTCSVLAIRGFLSSLRSARQ